MHTEDLQLYTYNTIAVIAEAVHSEDMLLFIDGINRLSDIWSNVDETEEGDVIQEVVDEIASINYPFETAIYTIATDLMNPELMNENIDFEDIMKAYVEYGNVDEWGVE